MLQVPQIGCYKHVPILQRRPIKPTQNQYTPHPQITKQIHNQHKIKIKQKPQNGDKTN